MGQLHVVEQGECMSSIAARFGFDWKTLWNDRQNEDLKATRQDPNVLFPGDVVFIPTRTPATLTLPTGKRHRIVIKKPPLETLRVRLLDELDRPREGLKYELDIDGEHRTGTTNSDGELVEKIRPLTLEAKLVLIQGEERREYKLLLGALDPADTVSGAQTRLANLGFDPGPCDGDLGPNTRAALCEFQELMGLDPSGELDDDTQAALKEHHGR